MKQLIVIALILFTAFPAFTQQYGTLDSSFGTNGMVTPSIYSKIYDNNTFRDIAVQADGKIVAAGTTEDNADFENTVFYNLLARYLPDGTAALYIFLQLSNNK